MTKKKKDVTPREWPGPHGPMISPNPDLGSGPYSQNNGKPYGGKPAGEFIKDQRKKKKKKKKSKCIKCAEIRKNTDDPCPFGLKVPYGCKNAGDIITKMAPVAVLGEDATRQEIKSLINANKKLLLLESDNHRCIFADKIFKDQEAVECNYYSNTPGESQQALEPSKFYSRVYENVALDGLYSFPMGWYGDNNISRNLYYGIYSITELKSNKLRKEANYTNDISDAAQHMITQEDSAYTGRVCYTLYDAGEMSLNDILQWDNYNEWGDFEPNELSDLSEEELYNKMNEFRPGYGEFIKKWFKEGSISPIILVNTLESGKMIGDGRGRVNIAVGLGMDKIPVIIMNESEDGDVCFNFVNGQIR